MTDDLRSRLEELESRLEAAEADRKGYREQILKPRLEEMESARDDARADRAELRAAVADLRDRVAALEVGIESVIGLAEGESTGPEKRCADLRLGLIRAAEASPDGTTACKHWQDVQDFFAEHGHGEVKKPECYDAMADVAEYDGFWTEEKALVLPSGRSGRGVFVDTDALPARDGVSPSSDSTTLSGGDRHSSAADD